MPNRGDGSVFLNRASGRWHARVGRRGRVLAAATEEEARALLPVLRAERDAAARQCEVCQQRPVAPGCSVTCGAPECRRKRKRDVAFTSEPAEARKWAGYTMTALASKVGKAGDADSFHLVWGLIAEAEQAVADTIGALRGHGYSWEQIGASAGMSKQALSQWASRHPADGTQPGTPGPG